jgi:hypothetical protein
MKKAESQAEGYCTPTRSLSTPSSTRSWLMRMAKTNSYGRSGRLSRTTYAFPVTERSLESRSK